MNNDSSHIFSKLLKRLCVLALACACIALPLASSFAAPSTSLGPTSQSPEDSVSHSLRCNYDSECPSPAPQAGQSAECLDAACRGGKCVGIIRANKVLGQSAPPTALACYTAPLVCNAKGEAVPSKNSDQSVAIREGEVCAPDALCANECQRPVCRTKRCVCENDDQATCTSSSVKPNDCQKRACRSGACQAVPDQSKIGSSCISPTTGNLADTANCRTTRYACNSSGECRSKTAAVANGAECAPEPLALSGEEALPSAFKELLNSRPEFPTFSCTQECKLEWCGDGKISGSEMCDGAARAPGVGSDADCNPATCQVRYSATIDFAPARMIYGERLSAPQLNASVTNWQGAMLKGGQIDYSSKSASPYQYGTRPNAGSHPVTASWQPDAVLMRNYRRLSTIGTLIVDPKPITCKARSYTKQVGEPTPAFEFDCDQLVDGDSLTDLGGAVGLSSGNGDEPGTYPITFLSAPSSPNYRVTLIDGQLSVNGQVSRCGDSIKAISEECDGGLPIGHTCQSGYDCSCNQNCQIVQAKRAANCSYRLQINTGEISVGASNEALLFCGVTPGKTCPSREEVAKWNAEMRNSCNPEEPGDCQFINFDPKCVPTDPIDNRGDPRCAPDCLSDQINQISTHLGTIKEGSHRLDLANARVNSLFKLLESGGAVCTVSTGSMCTSFETRFDKSCKQISIKSELKTCGVGNYEPKYTPISLLWGQSAKSEFVKGGVAVKFALNPSEPPAWINWRGSEHAPLLIKKGVEPINQLTGKSLFGSFTDGGQISADGKVVPWSNGFEPLRLLDLNGDQYLSKDELKSLALWFDANRNASVDADEMKDLVSTGVTKIYVGADRIDTQLGYPTIERGFTRREGDNQIFEGDLVDWDTTAAAEPARAVAGTDSSPSSQQSPDAPALENKINLNDQLRNQLSGRWNITFNPEHFDPYLTGTSADAALILEVLADGSITGVSITQIGVEPNKDSVRNITRGTRITGVVTAVRDGSVDLRLEAKPADSPNQTILTSKATIMLDQQRIRGKTHSTTQSGSTTGSYLWAGWR